MQCVLFVMLWYSESQERTNIKEKEALNLLDDFAEIGVKGVSLISDGESTLSKSYVPFIQHAKKVGVDIANATNGWEWGEDKVEQVLPFLKWVRFTVAVEHQRATQKLCLKDQITHMFLTEQ